MSRRHRRPPRRPSWYVWHRRIGLLAALFVLLLSITGLTINHSPEFGLDTRHIAHDTLLDLYGIEAPEAHAWPAGSRWVVQVGERLYLDARPVAEGVASVVGAVVIERSIVVAAGAELIVIAPETATVEERVSGAAGVPAGMRAAGITHEGLLALRAAHGDYTTDATFTRWHETHTVEAAWSAPGEAPTETVAAASAHWKSRVLTAERLLLDLHSGRLFGRYGALFMDAVAVLFVLLAVSGVWLWGKRRPARHGHTPR